MEMIDFVGGYFTVLGVIVLAGTILNIAREKGIIRPGKV